MRFQIKAIYRWALISRIKLRSCRYKDAFRVDQVGGTNPASIFFWDWD